MIFIFFLSKRFSRNSNHIGANYVFFFTASQIRHLFTGKGFEDFLGGAVWIGEDFLGAAVWIGTGPPVVVILEAYAPIIHPRKSSYILPVRVSPHQ